MFQFLSDSHPLYQVLQVLPMRTILPIAFTGVSLVSCWSSAFSHSAQARGFVLVSALLGVCMFKLCYENG